MNDSPMEKSRSQSSSTSPLDTTSSSANAGPSTRKPPDLWVSTRGIRKNSDDDRRYSSGFASSPSGMASPSRLRRRGSLSQVQSPVDTNNPVPGYYTSAAHGGAAPPYSPPTAEGRGVASLPLPSKAGDGTEWNGARNKLRASPSPSPLTIDEDEEEEDVGARTYYANPPATPVGMSVLGSGKKKRLRTRAGSFSYLPFNRRRRQSAGWGTWLWHLVAGGAGHRSLRRRTLPLLGVVAAAALLAAFFFFKTYEVQVEFSIFSRTWVRQEFDQIAPLKGCFAPPHITPQYNMTKHCAGKRHMLAPGLSLRRGMSCYDYASTIRQYDDEPLEPLLYHTYWRSDLTPFGERQAATLISYLATQALSHSKLILWSNGADTLATNEYVKPFITEWKDHIEVRQVDMGGLTRGTELDGLLSKMDRNGLFDKRGWVDGDALRLLVLWHYGGLWVDMDMILTRDLHPLAESEWVTQWDCYDKPYYALNGALMHFFKHSPYLCEAFHIMASSPLPQPGSVTWGSHLYAKLHRRLIAAHIEPFGVLPWCFSDPRNCREDIRFPDPFKPDPSIWAGRAWDGRGEVGRSGKEMLEERIGNVFTIHLHNQWKKPFPAGGYIDRLMTSYRDEMVRLRTLMGRDRAQGRDAGGRDAGGRDAGGREHEQRPVARETTADNSSDDIDCNDTQCDAAPEDNGRYKAPEPARP